jgi:hypothetical protein
VKTTPIRLEGFTPLQLRKISSDAFKERSQNGFHRIEVEHCLRASNASLEEIAGILACGQRSNIQGMGRIAEGIANSTSEIVNSLERIEGTIENSMRELKYAVEAGNLATQALLLEIWKGIDPKSYLSAVEAQRKRDVERRHLAQINHEYRRAKTYYEQAMRETNQSKAAIMLREVEACFNRATQEVALQIDAHFELDHLLLLRDGNLDGSFRHFELALGEPYSEHWIRVSRMLAHVDYRRGNIQQAYDRISHLILHYENLGTLAEEILDIQHGDDWNRKEVKLKRMIQRYSNVISLSAAIQEIARSAVRDNYFSALNMIEENANSMAASVLNLRPDPIVLYDAARYSSRLGEFSRAKILLEKLCTVVWSDLNTRHFLLSEAMSCPDFHYE